MDNDQRTRSTRWFPTLEYQCRYRYSDVVTVSSSSRWSNLDQTRRRYSTYVVFLIIYSIWYTICKYVGTVYSKLFFSLRASFLPCFCFSLQYLRHRPWRPYNLASGAFHIHSFIRWISTISSNDTDYFVDRNLFNAAAISNLENTPQSNHSRSTSLIINEK
jgi:hypothetical protein